MPSQLINFRLTASETEALKEKQLEGESLSITARRLVRETLGFPGDYTPSTTVFSKSTGLSVEDVEALIAEHWHQFAASENDLLLKLQEKMRQLETSLGELYP